jgi:hypothetical protein
MEEPKKLKNHNIGSPLVANTKRKRESIIAIPLNLLKQLCFFGRGEKI